MWTVTVEGKSKVTLLNKGGLPIARFYAGRFDSAMLARMVAALNEAEGR